MIYLVFRVAVVTATIAYPDPAREEQVRETGPRAHPVFDATVTAAAGGGWLALAIAHPSWARTSCPCRDEDVNRFDRPFRLSWNAGEPLAHVSAGLSLLLAYAGLAVTARDGRELRGDALLVTESAFLAGFMTQTVKTAASRPFPFMHGDDIQPERIEDGANYASLWSGHTTVPMAAATTAAWVFHRRHPHSPWRWVLWVAGPTLAVAAGLLQMAAGNHYPTDVVAGAAAGATVGLLNPWLHER